MLKTLRLKRHHGRTAQALVEFTLTALVFLMLIVMLIEVARILQAYVTIQHAAREAVRYAVTGEFDPKYGENPLAGWQADRATADPLKSIRPCWPLFADDHYAPTTSGVGWIDEDYYEPYRDARTCSVEEVAVRSLAGLILNPHAEPADSDYYDILVSGYSQDSKPSTGNFQRGDGTLDGLGHPNMETLPYLKYYHAATDPAAGPYTDGPPVQGDQPYASRGYAGDPGDKVQVQLEYRIRIITPFLMNIAPSVRLYTLVSATVETFGSTGLQREAILPPDPIEPLSMISDEPPDLYISSFTCSPGSVMLGDDLECIVTIMNKGKKGAASADDVLRVYYSTSDLNPFDGHDLDDPLGESPAGLVLAFEGGIDGMFLEESANSVAVPAEFSFPAVGSYYLYAWADANTGGALADDGNIQELASGFEGYERIANNMEKRGPISVIEDADLSVTAFTATPPVFGMNPGPGEQIRYDVTILNDGPSPARNVTVTPVTVSPDLECVGSCVLNLGDMADNTSASGSFIMAVKSGTVGPVSAEVCIVADTDTNETNTGNNGACEDILVGGDVSLTITKSNPVPASVNYGDTTTTIAYTLTVTNNGAGDASTVVVTDTLDSRLVFDSAAPVSGTWSCSPGSPVTCTLPSLAGEGASASVRIMARLRATPPVPVGDIPNHAEVTCAELAAVPNVQSNEVTVTVLGADIEIRKTANVASVLPGGRIIYTVRAINSSLVYDATGVTVRDILPDRAPNNYVQHVSSPPTHGSYDPVSGLWNIGALPRNTMAELTITVDVLATVPAGTDIDNTATLESGSPPDLNSGNNTMTARVTVSSDRADMVLDKQVSAATARPGDTLTYTLILTNNGPADVTGRVVEDTTLLGAFTSSPPLFQFLSADSGGNGAFSDTTGRWENINLLNGASATATIQVRVLGRGADEPFMNTAAVISSPTIPEDKPGDESNSATVQIDWPDPIFINAGDEAGGCVTSTWGSEDPVLQQDYSWQVGPSAAWSLLNANGEPTKDGLIDLNDFHFIRHAPDSAPFTQLGSGGQNLFGCSTRTGAGTANDFIYQFNSLLPGRWRVFLAFAEHTPYWDWIDGQLQYINQSNARIKVEAHNGTDTWVLLNNYRIVSAVEAQPDISMNKYLYDGDWWVHYIVEQFDNVVVSAPFDWLQIRVEHVNRLSKGRINGLGIEYIGP